MSDEGRHQGPGAAEAVPVPEPIALPILHQRWEHSAFLHWRHPPEALRRVVPAPLEVDLHDGHAWVSLVMFKGERTRLPGLPPVPFVSTFTEINLRTYVISPGDRPALWFFTLEAPQPLVVVAGRLLSGVPYNLAATSTEVRGDVVEHRSRRLVGSKAALRLSLRRGEPFDDAELTPLDHFLTARWGAYTFVNGKLRYTPAKHQMWPLHHAEVLDLEETITAAYDVATPGTPPLVHYATAVDATLGLHRPVRRG